MRGINQKTCHLEADDLTRGNMGYRQAATGYRHDRPVPRHESLQDTTDTPVRRINGFNPDLANGIIISVRHFIVFRKSFSTTSFNVSESNFINGYPAGCINGRPDVHVVQQRKRPHRRSRP